MVRLKDGYLLSGCSWSSDACVWHLPVLSLQAPGAPLYHQPVIKKGVQNSFPYHLAVYLLPVAGGSQNTGFGPDPSQGLPVPGTGCISSCLLSGLKSTWAPPWQWWRELHSPWDHSQLKQASQILLKDAKGPEGRSPPKGPARYQDERTALPLAA